MTRYLFSLLLVLTLLTACRPTSGPAPTTTPLPTSQQADGLSQNTEDRFGGDVQVWSLGGNGWAVEIGKQLLIFDYVEPANAPRPSPGALSFLQRGYIDAGEIKDYEVYVFVTHSHPDHFDPVIYDWNAAIPEISYIFGWQAGDDPNHHYLLGPRAQGEFGDLRVSTINSHHADVPEVAYLVQLNDLTIYFNGDYMSAYEEDFQYLGEIAKQIDIAFVIGWPYVEHQQFAQARALADLFQPEHIFASCREGDQDNCRQFKELLVAYGVDANIAYAEQRGQEFGLSISTTD